MNPFVRMRDYVRPVDRPPAGGPRDAWVHHGFRGALVLVIALSVPWLFPGSPLPEFDDIEPGAVADRSVIAAFDFDVPKDPEVLEADQAEAVAGVTPILRSEPARADTSIRRMNDFFAALDSAIAGANAAALEDSLDTEDTSDLVLGAVNAVVQRVGLTLPTEEDLAYITDPAQRRLLRAELGSALEGLRQGVIRRDDVSSITSDRVVVRDGLTGDEGVRELDEIPRMDEFYRSAQQAVVGRLPDAGQTYFRQLILQAQPTLRVDQDATRQARESARAAVQQVSGFVVQDESIIRQNEVVGAEAYQRLQAYQLELIDRGMAGIGTGFLHDLGMILFVASLLGILVFATYTFHRDIYEDARSFTVLLGLILIVLAVASVVATTESSPALIPVAFAGLLAAALFDSLLGLVVVAVIAGVLLGQPTFTGLPAPMIAVAGGVTAAFAVGGIRTRSQSWVLIALITGAYFATALCLNLMGHYSLTDLGVTTVFGFANATVCTALVMSAGLPALEAFTRRTTEQSLLELADMNRPLLRRLSREAPGTYAHSINLANLVEAACEAIGANSLLGRVGVYYHDIGKLERPQYFIENQPKGLNPHDRLSPWQSAEILRDHVRLGLRMAEEARLPQVVRNFIREHHGTQTIRYFLEKAREQEGVDNLDPNDFAYPGPKPQTKETGIAMLGDAVESASRTLAEPSPERIRALIARLVDDRVSAGELDECGLTFRDLGIVKQQFAHVLTGLYHHRIDYPTPEARPDGSGGDAPRLEATAGTTGSGAEARGDGAETRGDGVAGDSTPVAGDDAETPGSRTMRAGGGAGQLSIGLDQAAQGDTGPVPRLDPVQPPAQLPESAGTGRRD